MHIIGIYLLLNRSELIALIKLPHRAWFICVHLRSIIFAKTNCIGSHHEPFILFHMFNHFTNLSRRVMREQSLFKCFLGWRHTCSTMPFIPSHFVEADPLFFWQILPTLSCNINSILQSLTMPFFFKSYAWTCNPLNLKQHMSVVLTMIPNCQIYRLQVLNCMTYG